MKSLVRYLWRLFFLCIYLFTVSFILNVVQQHRVIIVKDNPLRFSALDSLWKTSFPSNISGETYTNTTNIVGLKRGSPKSVTRFLGDDESSKVTKMSHDVASSDNVRESTSSHENKNTSQNNISKERKKKMNNKSSKSHKDNKKPSPKTPPKEVLKNLQDEYYIPRTNVLNTFKYSYKLPPPSHLCDENTDMIILINSKIDQFTNREGIRYSWGSAAKNATWPPKMKMAEKIAYGFVLGTSPNKAIQEKIEEEHKINGDIVQGTFVDAYRNMTMKSLQGMKFAVEFCSQVPIYVKADDDVFIHLPNLVNIAAKAPPRSITGRYLGHEPARRNGKWKLTFKEFPFTTLPEHEAGALYIITMDVVPELFNTSKYIPYIFIDDVHITGTLAKIVQIEHVQNYSRNFPIYANELKTWNMIKTTNIAGFHKFTSKTFHSQWNFMTGRPQSRTHFLDDTPTVERQA